MKKIEKFLDDVEIEMGVFGAYEATFAEALDFIWFKAYELDPEKKGFNINVLGQVYLSSRTHFQHVEEDEATFLKGVFMKNMTFRDFLNQVAEESNHTYTVTSLGVVLQPNNFKSVPTPLADALAPEIKRDLQAIIIPETILHNCLIEEAVEYLSLRSRELAQDTIGFEVTLAAQWEGDKVPVIRKFNAANASLGDLLDFFAKSCHLDYEVEGRTIILSQAQKREG